MVTQSESGQLMGIIDNTVFCKTIVHATRSLPSTTRWHRLGLDEASRPPVHRLRMGDEDVSHFLPVHCGYSIQSCISSPC